MKSIFSKIFAAAICATALSCSTPEPVSMKWATMNVRYDNPADSMNNWMYRKDSVANFINSKEIDVIGMQEVLNNQLEDLKSRLPEYDYVGVGREDGNTAGEYAPIFYKKERFELIESSTFWLSQYPDSIGFIGWDGACTRIATWAKLKDKASGKTVFAVNTHFDHVGTTARKEGALLIIDRIKQLAGNAPTVLTGDLNVPEKSEAYETITGNEFKLLDAMKVAEKSCGTTHTFHDFGRLPMEEHEKIDYVFVTPDIKVKNNCIPEEGKLGEFFISDHNPQVVTIEIN